MDYDWYHIINEDDFIAMDVPSVELSLDLEDVGPTTVLVTRGRMTGLVFDTVYLCAELNNNNPFAFEGYAIYKDEDNGIWLGIEVPEEE